MNKIYLILFILLMGCQSSNIYLPENKNDTRIALVINRRLLEDRDIVYLDDYVSLNVTFSCLKSNILTPKIYVIGSIAILNSSRSFDKNYKVGLKIETNSPYEWFIQIKPNSEGAMLFIFESKYQIGDKKLIYFKHREI